jgi:hypothetical protein
MNDYDALAKHRNSDGCVGSPQWFLLQEDSEKELCSMLSAKEV